MLGLSPPCTTYSPLMVLFNLKNMPFAARQQRFKQAHVLLDFAMLCARIQHRAGRKFYFEHPRRATSWCRNQVKDVERLSGVIKVHFDQCALGLCSPSGKPLKKPTTIMTNSMALVNNLKGKKCTCKTLPHKQIMGMEQGVKLSIWAAAYPKPMCRLLAAAVEEENRTK